jgi:hypothetical protein
MKSTFYEAIKKDFPECRKAARNGHGLTDSQCFLVLQTIMKRVEKISLISSIALLVIGVVGFASVIFVSL